MSRLIFLGIIIWLAYVVYKRGFSQSKPPMRNESDSAKTHDSEDHDSEDMVQCAHCAVHLPRSEAFLVNGQLYCSKDHIQKSSN
jgi:ABC-type nickel/cobalt efflux system permease component RcnA